MMKKGLLILTILISAVYLSGQTQSPKREFRAAWIATVTNLDWPTQVNLSTEQQKAQLINVLDMMKNVNMNAAVFQIRSECDAMYESPYDPWSYWLTGQQGKAPSPYYDPLTFAVEEAHKRGIELHAWFNPYRVARSVGNYAQDPKHVSQQHPEWVLRVNNLQFLDPGIPAVREYVRDVVLDVVNRYDIDGIHADDYFYPYEGITNQDDASWAAYNRGFTNRSDWRRDNVNLLLKMINDSLQIVKPEVKFGMSPFGIWKSGTPPGITGLSAYHEIYCDAIAWLHDRSIDYLTPQCYWPFGGGQDYGKLTNWWADSVAANERHFYPGQALYRQTGWSANEMPRQVRHNRSNENILGSVMFRALNIGDNPKGFTDSLKNDLYKYVSIPPVMDWKGTVAPNAPQNLRLERLASTAVTGLVWDKPSVAADGDSGRFYVVYLSEGQNFSEDILQNSSNIAELTGETSYIPESKSGYTGAYYFTVTALDRNNNESIISNVVELTAPATPLLAYPANEALNQRDTTLLTWNYTQNASSYTLQVAKDSLFNSIFVFREGLQDSTYKLSGMYGHEKYFWRVMAKNIVGQSEYSETRSFTTGFPLATTLISPTNETVGIPISPQFTWHSVEGATNYRLQVVKSVVSWSDNLIVLDVKGITDTTYIDAEEFKLGGFYSWRIMAGNDYGYGAPSPIFKFQVVEMIAPETPLLALPVDEAVNQRDTTLLKWNKALYASSYSLQVAKDSLFNTILLSKEGIPDSTFKLTGMEGHEKYYWHVLSKNKVGQSQYSETWSFTTGFPLATTLVYPVNDTTGIPEIIEFKWNMNQEAERYRLQVAKTSDVWNDNLIILDEEDITDTVFTNVEQFELGASYSWRVMAGNQYGYSAPSSVYKFGVNTVSNLELAGSEIPTVYNLYQNYPNPFNPATQIAFDLPESGLTTIKIFNTLGQQVAELLNKNLSAGKYSIDFNASYLPSGIYIYSLSSNNKRFTKKMVLVK